MKILVTGAAGFIARNLVPALQQLGHEVDGIDYRPIDPADPVTCNIWEADLATLDLDDLDVSGYQQVWHLAAYAAEAFSSTRPVFTLRNNLGSTALVASACHRHQVPLVFFSSGAIYGNVHDPYTTSKIAGEEIIQSVKGFPRLIVRPHNVYGPWFDINDDHRNVIGKWIRQLESGGQITVRGNGTQTRPFTFVGDLVRCLIDSMTWAWGGQAVNIGSNNHWQINEVANALLKEFGMDESKISYVDPMRESSAIRINQNDPRSAEFFSTQLSEGIRQTAQWYRDFSWGDGEYSIPIQPGKECEKEPVLSGLANPSAS